MKSITKAFMLAVIIIGIIGNLALICFAVINAMQQNYVGGVVSILCCLYLMYYILQLIFIYKNNKQTEAHSKRK